MTNFMSFYVMGYEKTEVCHPKLQWTDRCLHPKMTITAGNSWIAHRNIYFTSNTVGTCIKMGEEGMPRDPSYMCSSHHMDAGCYESLFCNSLNNENHLEAFKNYFFFSSFLLPGV